MSMKITVQRDHPSPLPSAALGVLSIDGVPFCQTLEDQVREIPGKPVEQWKIKGQTAIPAGRYRVTIDRSDRFGRLMIHVLDVPGFSGIRVHGGNTDKDVEGCIAVGRVRTMTGIADCAKVLEDLESRVALSLGAGENVYLEIH